MSNSSPKPLSGFSRRRAAVAVFAVFAITGLSGAQSGAVADESVRGNGLAVAANSSAGTAPETGTGTGTGTAEECPLEVAPRVVAQLDIDSGQQPENITADPDGSVLVTFATARQIARIAPDGTVRVLATVPAPPPEAETPAFGEPFLGGIVRADDGTLYFLYATGTPELTGIWRLSPGSGTPRRITPLPADGLPNGLALDPRSRQLYATDSVGGTIWRAPLSGGPAVRWSEDPALDPAAGPDGGFLGVNGIKVHNGSLWVTNHDRGTVLRFPLAADASTAAAGKPRAVAEGLGEIDDLLFTGRGNTFLVAGVTDSRIDLVRDDGTRTRLLTERDGLQNPTSLARHGSTVSIASAAQYTLTDPNVLRVELPDRI
ncbi:SMP-30/gluconolactonase/LRE family protein [Streptomyces sp. NPDC004726]